MTTGRAPAPAAPARQSKTRAPTGSAPNLGEEIPVAGPGRLTPGQLLRGLGMLAVIALWAVLAHLGSAGDSTSNITSLLGLTPIVAALALLLWRARHPLPTGAGIVVLLGGLAWLWPTLRHNLALLYFVQHIGTNLALATLFGRSLLGPGEALITQLARAVHHGEISACKRQHTRQVTVAWTAFFLANALLSAILWQFAPLAVWSTFANLLAMPLVALMFVGEYLWRSCVLPPAERPTIAQIVRAYRMHTQTRQPPVKP